MILLPGRSKEILFLYSIVQENDSSLDVWNGWNSCPQFFITYFPGYLLCYSNFFKLHGVFLIDSYVPSIAGAQSNQRSKKLNHAKEGGVACYLAGLCLARLSNCKLKEKKKINSSLKPLGFQHRHTPKFSRIMSVLNWANKVQARHLLRVVCTTYNLQGI